MVGFRVIYVLFGCLYMVTADAFIAKFRKTRATAHHWGYTDTNGPKTWDGVCRTGTKQSPINIELGSVVVKSFPSFVFNDDYLSKHKFLAKNNGHTIYVSLEDDSVKPTISGGGLGNKFIFEQLHLHWESEHEFDGKRGDLEMHVVHYNSKYNSFAEASTEPDGVAVIAVIFNESEDSDNVLQDFFAYILDESIASSHTSHPASPDNRLPGLKEGIDEVDGTFGFFSLRDLLPKQVSRFFRYEGSLTTPGCGEVVQWTIFINRLPVSTDVLDSLRTLRDHDGNLLSENFRPPQSLNGRKVYIQIRNYDDKPQPEAENLTNSGTISKFLLSVPVFCGLLLLPHFNYYKSIYY